MVHRISIADARVVALCVGQRERTVEQLQEVFPAVDPGELAKVVPPGFLWAFGAAAIEIADRRILLDAGFAFRGDSGQPGIADLLEEAGIDPTTITDVVLTHAHGDHLGGLLAEGSASFPRATLSVSADEHRAMAAGVGVGVLDAYAGRITMVGDGDVICARGETEVRTVDAAGHTAGHIVVEVVADGGTVLFLADTVHAPFQLERLDWSPRFDVDPRRSTASRRRVLSRAADSGALVHAFHFPFPSFGRVRRTTDSFIYEPVDAYSAAEVDV